MILRRFSAAGATSLGGIAFASPAIPHNGSSAADNNNSFFIERLDMFLLILLLPDTRSV